MSDYHISIWKSENWLFAAFLISMKKTKWTKNMPAFHLNEKGENMRKKLLIFIYKKR